MELLNIGYGNYLVRKRVVSILDPDSLPMKRFRDEARKSGQLIDATKGRKTRAIILLDSGHVILSGIQTETLFQRFGQEAQDE